MSILGFKALFKEKKGIHLGCISLFPVLISNTWLIYSPGLIFKRNKKARQESECPTFLEIPVISLVLLKFSASPTDSFKLLASLSMSEFTTYVRIISYLSLLYVMWVPQCHIIIHPSEGPSACITAGLEMLLSPTQNYGQVMS